MPKQFLQCADTDLFRLSSAADGAGNSDAAAILLYLVPI